MIAQFIKGYDDRVNIEHGDMKCHFLTRNMIAKSNKFCRNDGTMVILLDQRIQLLSWGKSVFSDAVGV